MLFNDIYFFPYLTKMTSAGILISENEEGDV